MSKEESIYLNRRFLNDEVQIRMRFWSQNDRWSHALECVHQDQVVPILTSIEGTAEETFPASPPIQEVLPQLLGGDDSPPVMLGMGMAGKGHWSISTSIETNDDGTDCFRNDLACLQKTPETDDNFWLGSTYLLGEKWKRSKAVDSSASLSLESDLFPLVIHLTANLNCSFSCSESNSASSDAEWIKMNATETSPETNVATRWIYDFAVSSNV